MDPLTSNGLSGLGGGFFGVLAGWLGIKSRLCGIEKRIELLSQNVRYEVTCEKICDAGDKRHERIEEMQKEIRDDIKVLINKASEKP